MWHEPARYLTIFADGRIPTIDDAMLEEEEFARRLQDLESSDEIAALSGDQFEAVLRGSIEEWMFYLHPSQSRIVTHVASGPSRVRGGPGTGKTVAALHRARHLAGTAGAERVLLTTFVNVLPAVWSELLRTFAPDEADSIVTRTVDSLVAELVGRPIDPIDEDGRRRVLESILRREAPLGDVIGGTAGLQREFETVIAGRRIGTKDDYVEADRSGTGMRLSSTDRNRVWTAYERYGQALRRLKKDDFSLLRLEALTKAEAGEPPSHLRFDGIIVDEAQDLTLAQVDILKALDRSENHSGLMVVGDGQQSIFPGGFSLRRAGLDVRGRSFLLHANWRNTQAIADAADAALGDVEVRDMEEDVVLRSTSEQRCLSDRASRQSSGM